MVGILSFVSLIGGVGAACATDYMPMQSVALERWGGGLLVAGLALMGVALGGAFPIVH